MYCKLKTEKIITFSHLRSWKLWHLSLKNKLNETSFIINSWFIYLFFVHLQIASSSNHFTWKVSILLVFTYWSLCWPLFLWAPWESCVPISMMKMPVGVRGLSRFMVSIFKFKRKWSFTAPSQMKWPACESELPPSPSSPNTLRTHFDPHWGAGRKPMPNALCGAISIDYT